MNDWVKVLSGEKRGPGAAAVRLAAAMVEPFYATGMLLRNKFFDAGILRTHALHRPTISVGNLTTGGTGKTPMVRWLAGRLRKEGRRPAILARGYKSAKGNGGDEQLMLQRTLNIAGETPIEVLVNPNRVRAAAAALQRDPGIDVFILDDGFQHRAAGRNLNLLMISAPEPFGFGHVLPRGLLREPLGGIGRADAIVLTHSDQVSPQALAEIEQTIHRYAPSAPTYRAIHAHVGLLHGDQSPQRLPIDMLRQTPFFAFAGIGDPVRFEQQLSQWGEACRGKRWFADHHAYTTADLAALRRTAADAGAQVLVTTEKDWAKLASLDGVGGKMPLWRIELAMRFVSEDETRLWQQIAAAIGR
jgi:tetraacyldisaccharide 4'-kinase